MEVRVDVYSAKRRLSCGYKRHLLDYNTEVMGTRIDADWSVVDPSGGNDQGALAPLRFSRHTSPAPPRYCSKTCTRVAKPASDARTSFMVRCAD